MLCGDTTKAGYPCKNPRGGCRWHAHKKVPKEAPYTVLYQFEEETPKLRTFTDRDEAFIFLIWVIGNDISRDAKLFRLYVGSRWVKEKDMYARAAELGLYGTSALAKSRDREVEKIADRLSKIPY